MMDGGLGLGNELFDPGRMKGSDGLRPSDL